MRIEAWLTQNLGALVENRIYSDTTPEGTIIAKPTVIIQQVGGEAFWWVEGTQPEHEHSRMQIEVWSKSRVSSNAIARQIEKVLSESGLAAQPYGTFTAIYDESLLLYGTRQQFGIWYPRG